MNLGGHELQVGWGESTMIQAERLLLEAALEDPANQRFVLLSDRLVWQLSRFPESEVCSKP